MCDAVRWTAIVAEEGFERNNVTDLQNNDLQHSPNSFGTDSGTLQDRIAVSGPELQAVIDRWPSLTVEDREAVLAIVRSATSRDTADR